MTQQLQMSILNSVPVLENSVNGAPGSLYEAPIQSNCDSELQEHTDTDRENEGQSEAGHIPAYTRLVQDIINQIRSGRLKPGDTLQSTRELAVQLNLSRGTVRRAYQELLDRGFTEGKPGSKTVVRELAAVVPPTLIAPEGSIEPDGSRMLPMAQWREKALQCLSSGNSRSLDALSETIEFERLRLAICNYLLRYKGIRCDASQLSVFSNRHQAFEAAAEHMAIGSAIAIDNTTDPVVQKIFADRGIELRPVNTETEGSSLNELNALPATCKTFLTTPTDEYLLGSTITLSERREILRWARQRGVTILEEASECENQYCPSQIPSLHELSGGANVFYLYSFGKMLNPLTDMTVVVAPCGSSPYVSSKSLRPSLFETAILSDLIVDGALDSFIRRRHRHYRKLRQTAYFEMTVGLGRFVKISPEKCAHHLVVDFSAQWSPEYILSAAENAKLSLTLFENYHREAINRSDDKDGLQIWNGTFSAHANRYLLNFLCQSPDEIAERVRAFATILTREVAV